MTLSSEEEQVLFDANYLRVKRKVGAKIEAKLSSFEKKLTAHIRTLPEEHIISGYTKPYPKISRGENYGGLPYFMLDYPRVFTNEDTFAFRTMVYWATHISFTFHVSGKGLEKVKNKLLSRFDQLTDSYICVGPTPWEYHYNPDNYLPLHSLDRTEYANILNEKSFIKISKPYPIAEYENLTDYGLLFFMKINSILN